MRSVAEVVVLITVGGVADVDPAADSAGGISRVISGAGVVVGLEPETDV
jgi:hypothetical protein